MPSFAATALVFTSTLLFYLHPDSQVVSQILFPIFLVSFMSFETIHYVSFISGGILGKKMYLMLHFFFFFNNLESSSTLRHFLFYLETLLEHGLDVRDSSQLL